MRHTRMSFLSYPLCFEPLSGTSQVIQLSGLVTCDYELRTCPCDSGLGKLGPLSCWCHTIVTLIQNDQIIIIAWAQLIEKAIIRLLARRILLIFSG